MQLAIMMVAQCICGYQMLSTNSGNSVIQFYLMRKCFLHTEGKLLCYITYIT